MCFARYSRRWAGSAGRWFETAGKASTIPHAADDDEKGANCLLIYCVLSRTVEICLPFMVQCVPRYPPATETVTARTVFDCEFVLEVFVRLVVPRRRCRDREGISGRLLTLTG